MNSITLLVDAIEHLGAWGIVTTDADLRIVGWNRWLEKHSGKASHDVLSRSLFEVYPQLHERGLERYYQQALDGQSSILSQRFHGHLVPLPPTADAPDVTYMQQTCRISPLIDQGIIRGTLTLIEDVTERVVTEQELRQQAKRLEDANRHKDEFLAMLAHELRNPLAPIRNGIIVLKELQNVTEEGRSTCNMIERQVSHMARLVDDLLDVSRIVRGKVTLRKERCNIVEVAREVADDYRPILGDVGIALQCEIPSEACWISGDCVRLAQIISNLLQNASKFTNSGGEVCVAVTSHLQDGIVVIRVSDTGIGMNADTLSRVFEAFSQAESTLERAKGGLGLGLALVKGLAELHGGSVQAHSDGVGKGSIFTVTLPISLSIPKASSSATAPKIATRPIKNVLVIEDNHDMAATLKLLIQHLGYPVSVANSGSQGLEVAKTLHPDVVLCDIGLPGMSGFDVARALREEASMEGALLIAQSGYGQQDDIRQSLEAGFDLHLVKPVNFAELRKILHARNGSPLDTRDRQRADGKM